MNFIRDKTPRRFWRWLFNDPSLVSHLCEAERAEVDWLRATPFLLIHVACLGILFVGVSPSAVIIATTSFFLRMFFISAFYHRYFSHRAFRANRIVQFLMALAGCTAGQRGALWWAGHHREHHETADSPSDPHSPLHRGFLYSHTLWFLTRGSFAVREARVNDWLRYPELEWLERLDFLPFILFAIACYCLGAGFEQYAPEFDTSAEQILVWGFFVSTVFLYHATYTINSLAHGHGSRRYATPDDSRNNLWLALITLGEGWHNNHHRYPAAARQGFYWWEIDVSFLILKLMSVLGIVGDLRPVPAHILTDKKNVDP